jgi:hypothetical protein
LSIRIVEYFSWCDCANRRHAIIAGFSFQEVWFSRRKFILAEKIVRFAATSHGGKPLPANVSHFSSQSCFITFALNRTDSKKSIEIARLFFIFNLCFGSANSFCEFGF